MATKTSQRALKARDPLARPERPGTGPVSLRKAYVTGSTYVER